jgi:uncharacterized repeat protein (TIGR02543 family)
VVITWIKYDLTLDSTEGGSVTTPGEGIFAYGNEAVVDLVATPHEGYRFNEWTGSVSTIAHIYANATNITMNSDYTITANFAVIYDLITSSTAGGSVTNPGEGVHTYDEGALVDLEATTDGGYQFVGWSGDVGTITNVYAASTTVTMNGDYSIVANFEEISLAQYDLAMSSTTGGSVTTPGEGVFRYGQASVVGIAVEAEDGYGFAQWTGNVSTVADVYAASFSMTSPHSVQKEAR